MAKGRRRSRETPRGDRARSGRARADAVPTDGRRPRAAGAEPGQSERTGSRATLSQAPSERPAEPMRAEPMPARSLRDDPRPVEDDGVRTVAVITVLWAVAFVVLAFQTGNLEAQGRGWWLWTCLAGVGLGLLGLEYTLKRRDAIEAGLDDARAAEAEEAEAAEDAAAHAVHADADAERADDPGPELPGVADGAEPTAPEDEHVRPRRSGDTGPLAWPEPAAPEHPAAPGHDEFEPGVAHADPAREQPDTRTTRPIDTGHGEARPVRDPVAPEWPAAHSRPGPTRRPVADPQTPRHPAPSSEPHPEPYAEARPAAAAPPPDTETETDHPADTVDADDAPRADTPLTDLFGQSRADASRPADDDEPLLDTTLAGGHSARRDDIDDTSTSGETGDTGEITEGGGRQYRGRRARRSDSA